LSRIHLTTFIKAPVERVFDLSRSINLHKISTAHTREVAVAGTITGLISLDETVTWEARHLFRLRRFTTRIKAMEKPVMFIDEMTAGDFKSFRHEHHFKSVQNGSLMIDEVEFEPLYGKAGKLFARIYLAGYLEKLLARRNGVIKDYAESQKWKLILN
jgi:ligand-binding SRPBCC domain-containing protein